MQTKRHDREPLFTLYQLTVLIALGIVLGQGMVFYTQHAGPGREGQRVAPEDTQRVTYSKNMNHCAALCTRPPERVPEPTVVRRAPLQRAARQPGTTRLADISKKAKNPNAIRISLAEAPPILAKVKMVNGRPTCAKKNDKGSMSDKYNHVHVDQECCLDPDEVPNPRCQY